MQLKDTLIGRILSKDYASLKDDIESIVAKKISNRIIEKKRDILNTINGITESKMEDDMEDDEDEEEDGKGKKKQKKELKSKKEKEDDSDEDMDDEDEKDSKKSKKSEEDEDEDEDDDEVDECKGKKVMKK